MYKILNDHSAPNLKQLYNKRNKAQTSYNLRNNQTDITLPNPKTEYLKRSYGTARGAIMAACSQPMRNEDVIRNPRGLNGRHTEASLSLWDWQKFEYYSIFSF